MIAWALPLSRMISICRLDRDETLTAASDLSFVPGNQRAQFKTPGLTCFRNQIEYDDRILDIEVRQMIATTAHAMMAHRDSKELSAPFVATVDSRTLHGLLKLHIRSFKFARLDSMRRTLLNQDGSFPRRAPAGHCEPVAATPRRPKLQAVKENTH